jgi:hypothetical protein
MKHLTKAEYTKKVKEITANFQTRNWLNYENRWLYHEQAVEWLKQLQPETILEIGSLGVKLREDSKVLDNGSWKCEYPIDFNQDVRELNISRFDCIVALRVLHHYPEDFERIFNYLKSKCNYLIIALPKKFKLTEPPTETKECKSTNIYLWK